jgi:sigma-B regulation protein RsbU (phosphoserine phosphatase)
MASTHDDRQNLGTGRDPQTARRRILVVDDDPAITGLVISLLRNRYEVTAAMDGGSALAIVASRPVDLVLLDVTMPGMDGIAVCRILKASPASRDIPVVFLSGHTDDGDVVLGFEAGGVDYVTKPFDSAILKARIATHLALRDSQTELARAHRALQEELSWAGELQRRLLSIEIPRGGPVRFSVAYEPLPDLHCGGDYYDVFDLAAGRHLVLLGDVSGHGLRAAFITVMLKSIIYRGYIKRHLADLELPAFIAWLNAQLCSELKRLPGVFVAVLAYTIDSEGRRAVFCNAGQHPPFILRGERIIPIVRHGPSLGFSPQTSWQAEEFALEPRDRIVAYTDGLIEIGSEHDTSMAGDTLGACAASAGDASALLAAVKEHAGSEAFTDDATVVMAAIV